MYTIQDITNIRDNALKTPNSDYCDILSDEIFRLIYDRDQEEHILIEEWEEFSTNMPYEEFVIDQITKDLIENSVSFVKLSNGSSETTFVHHFVLFNTDIGIIRLESYGTGFMYNYDNNGNVIVLPGYSLYCGRISGWSTWQEDLTRLLTINYGDERVNLWNQLFLSRETMDNEYQIDVIISR